VILEAAMPHAVRGLDPSAGFIEYAKSRIASPLASFAVGDAQSLPVDPASFDVAVAGLVLNFVSEPSGAIVEMARAVRPGGAVVAYVWDYAEKMELMRYFWDAAVALDPAAFDLDEGHRVPICAPKPLCELFAQAGLRVVEVRPIDVLTRFRDFDDYWSPFLGGQGPAPGYAMSLSEDRRNKLRDRVRSQLPVAPDGTIELIARAWAVSGRVPS
jgi:SAM-dependent methyltransferase